MELEHALLSCPFESLHQLARNAHKVIEHELGSVCRSAKADQTVSVDSADLPNKLQQLARKLRGVSAKMTELVGAETRLAQRCRQRLRHLQDLEGMASHDRHEMVMNRLLVDYLLRQGYSETASQLARQWQAEELCEFELFAQADRITSDLCKRHDVSKALQWCATKRSRLRKLGLSMEFDLRSQQVVELAKGGDIVGAIKHARTYMAPEFETRPDRVKELMMSLAFINTRLVTGKYDWYLSDLRWEQLSAEFRRSFLLVNGLGLVPLLDIHLQAGLSALKTPSCGSADHSMSNCPVCCADLVELAAKLAPARRTYSSMVCRISGQVMDEDNLPLMLPNGHIYSQKALRSQAGSGGGFVTCIQTQQQFRLRECRPVYFA